MDGKLTVYKASAGSGKTFTLAAEYVALLLGGDPSAHRHILAVTFTNKATAEMKERILQKLWLMAHLSKAEREGDGFFREVARRLPGLSGGELARRAAAALTAVVHDYDHFRVETIDSFFQSLLTSLAHELGLSSGFKVDINDREVIDRAVEALMAALPERPEVLSWVLAYIRERIEDNKRWDITRDVKELAHHLMTEKFLLHDEEVAQALDAPELVHRYRQTLRELERSTSEKLTAMARQLHEQILEAGGYESFSRGSSLSTYLKRITERNPEPPVATVVGYMEAPEKWLRKADVKKRPDLLAMAEGLRERLIHIEETRERSSRTINSCRLSLRHLEPMRLFGEINREVERINQETGRFMLAKTPLLFARLVGEADASFVFERAGTEFRHIMIDEFQDTSTLQWGNFKNLLVENMSQANGCLLVGDVKQSIYRFRNGDWSILAGIEREFAGWHPQIHTLATNYRSAGNIVAFNNDLFPRAAAQLDAMGDTQTIAAIYADVEQQAGHGEGGYVRICLQATARGETSSPQGVSPENDGVQAEEDTRSVEHDLAEQVIDLHRRGVPYEQMAILVRFNSSTPPLLSYFARRYPDIPIVSDEAFLLQSSPAVQLIVGAMRYMVDPSDTICRARLAYDYQSRVLGHTPEWDDVARQAETLLPEAYVADRPLLASLPLYEMALRLVELFRPERIEGSAPYLYCFLDAVLAFLDDNASDLRRFLTHWDETLCRKAIPAGEVPGVRVLTIHKSKGLAFHSVFMPNVDWPIERGPRGDMLWCVPTEPPYDGLPLLPVPLGSEKAVKASIYADAYEEEFLQRRIENLNLAYVAFTRAIQNLYIWAQTDMIVAEAEDDKPKRKTPDRPKTVGDLLYRCLSERMEDVDDHLFYHIGEPGPGVNSPAKKGAGKEPENPLEARPSTEWVEMGHTRTRAKYRQSNAATRFLADETDTEAAKRAEYISRGKLLHYIFAGIETATDVDTMITRLDLEGLVGGEKEAEALRRLVDRRLSDPQVKGWFDGSWRLYNECSILAADTSTDTVKVRRPDRVMMRDGQVVVVDFKFGKAREEYHDQVREYCDLLRRMGHADVRGYLWYVYSGETEEVVG